MPLEEQPQKSIDSINDNFELESQFILRLPSLPAASLRAAIKSGVLNLKDRLSIQIDQDIRNGVVRFDGWVLPAKIVDLPTILESLKTLDNKNFYKTSDISQIMICKEETDEVKEDPDEVVKKTKDGRDKKYLYPHGITKPLKNVRKRRFRKTLRKKYVDFPEIEKEVKRLLRQDNEATNVRFEIVNIEEENKDKIDSKEKESSNLMNVTNSALDDRDLFGDVVSSSDDNDDDDERIGYSDDGSRMSSTFRDYLRDHNVDDNSKINLDKNLSFSQVFSQQQPSTSMDNMDIASSSSNVYDYPTTTGIDDDGGVEENNEASYSLTKNLENESIRIKLQELEQEILNLQTQRHVQQTELDSIENMALKQRFQAIIDDLREQEMAKKREYDELKKSSSSSSLF
ncbi:transcription initiation factor tfiid subunit 7-like protein [Dermatophagoides farinae]|uniref:Transcription initiation factor tfiid subunit 7-like protein n=1 Tax=Dermatophagoides farinae TaxID=6954 RepID=A0A9D4P6Z0_DERFA|nr:transcription initiation factor TFIID subunit 7-like [Dermatophagoides farinae]KAH7645273.1 transcription initiation factor tfiid subunit 7-like protein [Dermatophagoides farinae]